MLGLRYVFALCGAGLFVVAAAQIAFAASDTAPSSRAADKGATSSTSHHSTGAARHRYPARPARHQATTHKEHKEIASRPATASPGAAADKSLQQRPLLGPFSLGIETDPKIKPRSLAGGEVDFEREPGVRSKYDPTYLGLSIKSPFSW